MNHITDPFLISAIDISLCYSSVEYSLASYLQEDEDPLPEDELPEHLRPQPQIQFDPSNIGDPENLLKMSKKGRTLMMFVQVKDELSPSEAEEITKLWQSSLYNNHIQAERQSNVLSFSTFTVAMCNLRGT